MHAWLHTQQVFYNQTLPWLLCEFLETFGPIAGVIHNHLCRGIVIDIIVIVINTIIIVI